ncbi:MAG: hypothetical protein QNJ54_15310 [Prochloraceae cyanobacterium]|nr:hypothetical protein [Prochloraceae cyanobacterium]
MKSFSTIHGTGNQQIIQPVTIPISFMFATNIRRKIVTISDRRSTETIFAPLLRADRQMLTV